MLGKIVRSLFFLPFLGMGLWFVYLMALGFQYQFDTYTWPRIECTILSSSVQENPGAAEQDESYVFKVQYRYEADGAEGTSDVYRDGYRGSSDISDALRLAQRYPRGSRAPCYVDPETPDTALLALESPWNALFIFFPLIFVAVGGAGIYFTWRGSPLSGPKPGRLRKSISSRASKSFDSPGCLAAFFSVFLLAGLGFFVPFFALPLYETWQAGSWSEVPCEVEYIAVRSHPGDDSTTYSVDVLYSYEFSGELYKSSRYDFFSGSDSGYASKKEFVDAHPAGTRTTCFVNPDDPLDAVLRRDYSENFLFALLPLIFVFVGGAGMAWALTGFRRKRSRAGAPPSLEATMAARARETATDSFGRAILKPSATPFGRLLGGIAIAVFWNGITGIFVWIAVANWDTDEGMGCLAIFLVPFVLIGLLLLVNIPYQILALFNPRPEMTLDRARLSLGSSTGLSWRFHGAAGRIRRLRITLEGVEKVTYRRGTDTRRDSNTFASIEVVDLGPEHRLESGQAHLEIPADAMHSFKAPNNQIVWTLKMHGEIRVWPDVSEEFEIPVEPSG